MLYFLALFGDAYFQLGVLLGKYSNVYFFIARPIPFWVYSNGGVEYIRTVVLSIFERWYSVSWITVCCLYLSWIIIIVYTESALSITWKQAPTNKERIKCEKNQLNNSFCVNTWWTCTIFACRRRYYPWRSKGYVQSVCNP